MVRWITGQSAHPKGRRRRTRQLADLLAEIGDEQVRFEDGPPEDRSGTGEAKEVNVMSRRERMARVLWTAALDGDLRAMRLIAAYTDGQPVQPVAVGVEVRFTADDYSRARSRVDDWRGRLGTRPASAALPSDEDGETT